MVYILNDKQSIFTKIQYLQNYLFMNAHLNLPKFNRKGDIYLLIKKDKISQLHQFQLNF